MRDNMIRVLTWLGWFLLGWWLLAWALVLAFNSNAGWTVGGIFGGAAVGHFFLRPIFHAFQRHGLKGLAALLLQPAKPAASKPSPQSDASKAPMTTVMNESLSVPGLAETTFSDKHPNPIVVQQTPSETQDLIASETGAQPTRNRAIDSAPTAADLVTISMASTEEDSTSAVKVVVEEVCRNCGRINRDQGEASCQDCKEPLALRCGRCNKTLVKDDRFCGECGAAILGA